MADLIVAVDLGGTLIRTAQMDRKGHIFARVREPIHANRGREYTLPAVIDAIRRVLPTDRDRLAAVGICVPGPLDPWKGIIINLTNIPGWEMLPFRDILSDEFGVPVWLGNDANVAALAEQRFGAARGLSDVIYITVSTGIGGGIIVDNRLLLGAQGLGAEIGHMTIEVDGPRCRCGNIGCLEILANGPAIARDAAAAVRAGRASLLPELSGGDLDRITARLVNEAAQRGDSLAIEILNRAGFYLGVGVVNLMHIFNPAMFVIGGGVTKAGNLLFGPMRETVQQRAMRPAYWENCPIVRADLGDDVGLLGALALVLSSIG
jgi:glucokinase